MTYNYTSFNGGIKREDHFAFQQVKGDILYFSVALCFIFQPTIFWRLSVLFKLPEKMEFDWAMKK